MCNTFIFQSLGFRVIFARRRSEQERARLSGSGTTSMSCGLYVGINLHHFLNSVDHPAALMCVETDPTECHRHRLCIALEGLGLRGFDL